MSLIASIFYVFLSPYPLIVLNSDSGFDHVTCFGQWDGSKLDSRELVKCLGNPGEWKNRWNKNEVFA